MIVDKIDLLEGIKLDATFSIFCRNKHIIYIWIFCYCQTCFVLIKCVFDVLFVIKKIHNCPSSSGVIKKSIIINQLV